jgi:hypothetical protein
MELVVDTPDDPEFLKQFARASMLHAHLDNTLKMFIRSFDGTSIEEALEYIGYQGAAKLRRRIEKLAREQLEGEALTAILHFMTRCEDISERRNYLLHSPIAREKYGIGFRMRARGGGNTWVELPKPEMLEVLADETARLVEEMNFQRLSGVIGLALSQRRSPK